MLTFRVFRRARFITVLFAVMLAAAVAGPGAAFAAPAASAATAPAPEPGVCQGCKPPLVYNGGLVMGATGTLTITPIYWAPTGFSFPGTYVNIVNKYIADVAAASGGTSNTYAILGEYYQQTGTPPVKTNIKYQIAGGTPITDTNPYPATASGCTITAPATTCTTQAQIEAELTSVLAAKSLAADVNHLYLVLFPPGTDQVFGTDHSITGGFCGIHKAFTQSSGGVVVYADEPYVTTGCTSGQSPNGNLAADTQVDNLSHEITEAMTDPSFASAGGTYSWFDSADSPQEIGDECSYNYGPALGSTDPNNPQTSKYNQLINGGKYYTQTIFSNASYNANIGQGKGCLLAAYNPAAAAARTAAPGTPSTATLDASPTELPADGASTSAVTVTVLDANGEPVAGDHIQFDVKHKDQTPDGECGTLDSTQGFTDAQGQVTATYTASTDQVACFILAIDAESGSSDSATIYQGTSNDIAPAITDASVPASLTPGGPAETFSVTAANPSSTNDIPDARFDVFLTGDNNGVGGGIGLSSSQVHLSYADQATGGQFVNVPLTGETVGDGEIDAFVVPDDAADLPPGGTITATFKISLDSGAPDTAVSGQPLRIETDLDQVDPADGSQSNLDYVGPADVPVVPPSDTVTFQGQLFQIPPTATRNGTGTLVSTSCSLQSQDDPAPSHCALVATATLTQTGGTLKGVITSGDGVTTFTENFNDTSSTTQTGTGSATEHDVGKPSAAAAITAVTTLSPTSSPLVVNEQGTIVVTDG